MDVSRLHVTLRYIILEKQENVYNVLVPKVTVIHRFPYVAASLAAALLAVVVWLCVPNEYTAITKLSDEYKEMDLVVGYKELTKHLRNISGGDNGGINNMAVYCKILKTEDFARSISHKRLSTGGMTYGEYLGDKDTIEAIQGKINYNYSVSQETLTISFTDKDPVVASQILDSITVRLQEIITLSRQFTADAALQDAKEYLAKVVAHYKLAQKEYTTFSDSHKEVHSQKVKQEREALRLKVEKIKKAYFNAIEEYTRQEALKHRSYMSFAIIQDNSLPMHPNKHLVGYLLSFIILSLLFTRAAILYKRFNRHELKTIKLGDYFSPWILTTAIWGVVLGLYYILDTGLYPITEQLYYCLILWIPIFCTSAIITYVLTPATNSKTPKVVGGIDINISIFNFFFIVTLIITPLYVYRVYQLVTTFGTEDLLNNVRVLAVHGDGQGFLNYSSVINQALFIVALWAHPRISMWKVVVLGIACLMNALAIMEKGGMLFVFVCIVFVLFSKGAIKLRSIVVSTAVIVILFYFFNLARAVDGSEYQENATLMDFFAQYALSPPVAFCQLMPDITPQFGTNTFETVYLFLRRFGADVVVKGKLQEFVDVPISTNVYTILQPFFIDFGYRGIAFFATLYGVVCGYLYRSFRNMSSIGTCLYTYGVYVLLMQFYQENVFLSLVFVLQFTCFTILFTQKKIRLSW